MLTQKLYPNKQLGPIHPLRSDVQIAITDEITFCLIQQGYQPLLAFM